MSGVISGASTVVRRHRSGCGAHFPAREEPSRRGHPPHRCSAGLVPPRRAGLSLQECGTWPPLSRRTAKTILNAGGARYILPSLYRTSPAGWIHAVPVIVQSRLGVQLPAGVSIRVGVAGGTSGHSPRWRRRWSARRRAVDVPFHRIAGGVDQRRDVEVGIAQVVDPLVIAQPIGIRVLVPQHRGVDVPPRPDVLVLRLSDSGPVFSLADTRDSSSCQS